MSRGGGRDGEGSIVKLNVYVCAKSSKASLSCPDLCSSHPLTSLPPSPGYEGLFDGEIFTRAFSPLLAIGALSPRYLASLLPSLPPSFPFFLLDKATKVRRREGRRVGQERMRDENGGGKVRLRVMGRRGRRNIRFSHVSPSFFTHTHTQRMQRWSKRSSKEGNGTRFSLSVMSFISLYPRQKRSSLNIGVFTVRVFRREGGREGGRR